MRGPSSGDNVDGTTNIIPSMGLDPLLEGYRKILEHIYAPEHYYARMKTFLREYKPPRIRMHLEPSHILALVRSVYQLGLVGQKRRCYWKLMLWTQFRRPRLMSAAVVLSIYGYHFRKVCERHVLRNGVAAGPFVP